MKSFAPEHAGRCGSCTGECDNQECPCHRFAAERVRGFTDEPAGPVIRGGQGRPAVEVFRTVGAVAAFVGVIAVVAVALWALLTPPTH